jgi:hypothetical protein
MSHSINMNIAPFPTVLLPVLPIGHKEKKKKYVTQIRPRRIVNAGLSAKNLFALFHSYLLARVDGLRLSRETKPH